MEDKWFQKEAVFVSVVEKGAVAGQRVGGGMGGRVPEAPAES